MLLGPLKDRKMSTKTINIGVFDSGIGGLSVARAIEKAFPKAKVSFYNDSKHIPYGTKTNEQLLKLALPILKQMQSAGCNVIVVACNTLTTTIIKELRDNLSVPLVAVEPMVKPAVAITKSKVIAVCATPSTLASKRYNQLKKDFATGVTVIEPDCSNWAELIENKTMDHQQIVDSIAYVISQKTDVIVLGCTHYHWIEQDIKKEAGDSAVVIQPEQAIIKRLAEVLKQLV